MQVLMQVRRINFIIVLTLVLLGLALWLVDSTEIDREFQKYFFDFQTGDWLIDANEPVKKFFFYKLPKLLLGLSIVTLLGSLFLGFNKKSGSFFKKRHKLLLIFLGLTLIPLTVANIKKFTNIYCPSQLEDYGGNYPYIKILDSYPQDFHQKQRGKCFPAGHATSGFALFILFFAFDKKSHRIFGLFSGIVLGWILGLYQIAKGAHFFGDTLVSMLCCFLVAALITRFLHLKILSDPDLKKPIL